MMGAVRLTDRDRRPLEILHVAYDAGPAVAVRVAGRRTPGGPSVTDAAARRLVDRGLARRSRPAGQYLLLTGLGRRVAADLEVV